MMIAAHHHPERAYPAPPARVVIATGEAWSVSARVIYPRILTLPTAGSYNPTRDCDWITTPTECAVNG